MAGNAFGFSQYPQRPTVDPRTVGKALVQKKAQQQPIPGVAADATRVAPGGGGHNALTDMHDMALAAYPGAPGSMKPGMMLGGRAALRMPGALVGSLGLGFEPELSDSDASIDLGFGSIDGPDGGDQHEDSAIQAMRHEAQRRVGFALEQGQQRQPAPAFAQEQLQRLGLSPAEIRLLRMAGGTK